MLSESAVEPFIVPLLARSVGAFPFVTCASVSSFRCTVQWLLTGYKGAKVVVVVVQVKEVTKNADDKELKIEEWKIWQELIIAPILNDFGQLE